MSKPPELKTYKEAVFGNRETEAKELEAALERAWQIRNFEIELYWKRALYFWGFIVLSFTAYYKTQDNYLLSSLGGCAGISFSMAWFLVNKASKFWQENWEAHIDCLEKEIRSNIYKTVLISKTDLLDPRMGYYFSVSKINQACSLFVCFLWLVLLVLKFQALAIICAMYFTQYLFLYCETSFGTDVPAKKIKLKDCKYEYFERSIEQ